MEYAQARIQARFGARPARADWQHLQGFAELGAFLEAANRTSLSRWIAGLDEQSGRSWMEISLRERLREAIRETAKWMPSRWRTPMAEVAQLVDLPALAYLARGGAPLSWMGEDPVLRAYLKEGTSGALAMILRPREGEPASPAASPPRILPPGELLQAWSLVWKQSWPARRRAERESLERVARRVSGHVTAFGACATPQLAHGLREVFELELRHEFRANALMPGAAFAYVALAALDLERVRALLLERLLAAGRRNA